MSALGWGVIGLLVVLASEVTLSGDNRDPQALVWALAYPTAYIVEYKTALRVFRKFLVSFQTHGVVTALCSVERLS